MMKSRVPEKMLEVEMVAGVAADMYSRVGKMTGHLA